METAKLYKSPKMTVVLLSECDVVCSSLQGGITWQDDKGEYGDLTYGGGLW